MIRRDSFLLLLSLLFSFAAIAQPVAVSNEFPTADPQFVAEFYRGAHNPVVVASNDGFLAFWYDDRSWARVARLDRNGALIDRSGFPLGQAAERLMPLYAFWNGVEYFTVVTAGNYSDRLFRIGLDGQIVEPSGMSLQGRFGVLTWSGSRLFRSTVEWTGSNLVTMVTILDGTGRILSPPKAVADDNGTLRLVAASSNGTDFLLIWLRSKGNSNGPPGYYASRVSLSGNQITTPKLVLATTQYPPAARSVAVRPAGEVERRRIPFLRPVHPAGDGA